MTRMRTRMIAPIRNKLVNPASVKPVTRPRSHKMVRRAAMVNNILFFSALTLRFAELLLSDVFDCRVALVRFR